MLQIQHLTMTLKNDLRTILNDFNLTISDGEKVVLIGEEGNGKSTILKWIYDPDSVSSYVETSGKCSSSYQRIGYLPQAMPAHLLHQTIYEYFSSQEAFLEETYSSLVEIAKQVHLPNDFYYSDQMIHTLSGGEKVKLQIASLLLNHPDLLLLDEPSNDLDIQTLEWLESFLQSTPSTVLYISHDETLIEHTAQKIIHLELLKRKRESKYTISNLIYSEYQANREHLFARTLQQALSDKREDEIRMEKYHRIRQKVEHDLRTISRSDAHGGYLLKKKMKAVKSMEKRFEREREEMTEIPIQEEAIGIHFENIDPLPVNKTILHLEQHPFQIEEHLLAKHIVLDVYGGDKICLIGRNGCGKSTLLKYIYHILKERTDIRVAYMPQNYEDLLDLHQTPIQFLAPDLDQESVTKARQYLGAMRYTTDEMEHEINALSGGQKGKIILLKMILDQANVLLLDEPTRNFSPLSSPVIRTIFHSFPGTIISVSHDRKYIDEVCDQIYEMDLEGLHKKKKD